MRHETPNETRPKRRLSEAGVGSSRQLVAVTDPHARVLIGLAQNLRDLKAPATPRSQDAQTLGHRKDHPSY